ncbi:hypothetical protein [Streptomyces mirabilis]|uniref:hypothetical protein n=1 Tax=Streptomyces mirabilis TaxID=68239 RepID=UPI00332654A5
MKTRQKYGPSQDTAFFKDVMAAFAKHPDAAKRYSIRYLGHEIDRLKIDFDRQVAESHIEGERIVTTFVDRPESQDDSDEEGLGNSSITDFGDGATPNRFCCEWKIVGNRSKCVKFCT